MRRSIVILAAIVLSSAAIFQTAHWGACQLCVARSAQSWDDLQWLRMEFKLSDQDVDRIRKLHDGYLPMCRQYCQQIAVKNQILQQSLETNTPSISAKDALRDIALLRAECQAEMLKHFEAVSRVMPPSQGERYLAEMRKITLGAHESLEHSMSPAEHTAHGNP